MKKRQPMTHETVLVDRLRIMAVGVFLFFVLTGIPSTTNATPIDFSVNLDSTVCGFTCTGTLFFTFDGTRVTFDTEKLSDLKIDTDLNSYLFGSSAPGALHPPSITAGYISSWAPIDTPSWIEYTRLAIDIISPTSYFYTGNIDPYTSFVGCIVNCGSGGGTRLSDSPFFSSGPNNPTPYVFFELQFTQAVAGANGAGYLEVGGAYDLNVVPQAAGVPEASSLLLLGVGLAGMAAWRQKKAAA